MAALESAQYPNLRVADLGVKFVDGVAEVRDKKTIDALLKIDGVTLAKPEAKSDAPADPDDE